MYDFLEIKLNFFFYAVYPLLRCPFNFDSGLSTTIQSPFTLGYLPLTGGIIVKCTILSRLSGPHPHQCISAVLMLGWRLSYIATPNDPTHMVSSKPSPSA